MKINQSKELGLLRSSFGEVTMVKILRVGLLSECYEFVSVIRQRLGERRKSFIVIGGVLNVFLLFLIKLKINNTCSLVNIS